MFGDPILSAQGGGTAKRDVHNVEGKPSLASSVTLSSAEADLVRGKTIGIDATTLEANAGMRSIERRDTGESYDAFLQGLAEASGIATPTRAELARFDRSRKNKTASNKDWQSPQDPDAKITKMKDDRTHLAHKVEHGVDMDTGAIVAVTVQDASEGDTATLPETLTKASEHVEAVQPDGREVEEVVADKGYHSDETLVALNELEVRSYISEPERGPRRWQDKRTGKRRRRSGLRRRRCMGTAGVLVGLGVVVCNGGVGSWWSVRSLISMRPGACGGCGCAVMRRFASACSSKRRLASWRCSCAAGRALERPGVCRGGLCRPLFAGSSVRSATGGV